jgi:hypothetical protein
MCTYANEILIKHKLFFLGTWNKIVASLMLTKIKIDGLQWVFFYILI